MLIKDVIWLDWGKRFRKLLRHKGSNLAKVADAMQLSESALRSWTNGNRQINLQDFFKLCEVAEVDPAVVLFAVPRMTEELSKHIAALSASATTVDRAPTAQSDYLKMKADFKAKTKSTGKKNTDKVVA